MILFCKWPEGCVFVTFFIAATKYLTENNLFCLSFKGTWLSAWGRHGRRCMRPMGAWHL